MNGRSMLESERLIRYLNRVLGQMYLCAFLYTVFHNSCAICAKFSFSNTLRLNLKCSPSFERYYDQELQADSRIFKYSYLENHNR